MLASHPPCSSHEGSHRTAVEPYGCRLRLCISACVNGDSLPPASCGRHAHSQQSPLPLLAMTDNKNSSTANPFEQHHGPGLRHQKLFVGMRRSANDDIDARAAARVVAAAAAAEEAALAQAGWEEMYDPDSRKVYWVNHRLNATRYVTPCYLVRESQLYTHNIFQRCVHGLAGGGAQLFKTSTACLLHHVTKRSTASRTKSASSSSDTRVDGLGEKLSGAVQATSRRPSSRPRPRSSKRLVTPATSGWPSSKPR
eukprot:COSAG01_NODE_4089_length_5361_cov_2.720258_2_plen_254_part_00